MTGKLWNMSVTTTVGLGEVGGEVSTTRFLIEIAVVCLAALVGGSVAKRLRQPLILGYLLAGVLVGPNTPGFVADIPTISVIAEWGVVFLLFSVGVEFSFRSLAEMWKISLLAGLIQIAASIFLGYALGRAFGLGSLESVLLGAIIAMSSTMVVMKLLDERGETDSYHGKVMLGILITQDLITVVFAAVIPFLANVSVGQLPFLITRLLLAVLYLALAVVLGVKILPRILQAVAATKSRELFTLTVVSISFGAAVGAHALGFSLALGAFVAGLIVGESEYRHSILAEVKPFRDLFAAVFFVSIGMLARPGLLIREFWTVATLVAAVVVGKFLIVSVLAIGFRLSPRVAITAGLGLAQIGEFSFVLARISADSKVASETLYALAVIIAVVTIFITPVLPKLAPRLIGFVESLSPVRRLLPQEYEEAIPEKVSHVVLCGHGRVGRRITRALEMCGFEFVVIDYDHNAVRTARERGISAIYGDASNPEILKAARAATAAAAVLTIPDAVAAGLAISHLRGMNREMWIIARAHTQEGVRQLYNAGANMVVWPELEAGIEMIRQLATNFGADPDRMVEAAKEEIE